MNEEKEDALKKLVEMQEAQRKKNQKLLIIILSVVFGVIILIPLLGFVIYQVKLTNKPMTDWGQTYYVYLKDMKKNKNSDEKIPNNAKVKFVDVKDVDEPVMVINYEFKENNYTNIYYIEENKVNSIIYQEPTEVNMLFNISSQEYNYYFHIEKDNQDYYQSLTNQIENAMSGDSEKIEETPEYVFDKEDVETAEDEYGNEIKVSEFDKTFVEIETNEKEFKYSETLSGSKLKDLVSGSVQAFKSQDEIVSDDVKEAVSEKIEELNKNIELIEMQSAEHVFELLKGVWITSNRELSIEVNYKNNKKYFALGWFASEAAIMGNIKDIVYKGESMYTVIVDDIISDGEQKVDVDTSQIDKKKIGINNYYTMTYVAANMDKAYEKLF